jgi:SNF2 family DNA or RNA helicase
MTGIPEFTCIIEHATIPGLPDKYLSGIFPHEQLRAEHLEINAAFFVPLIKSSSIPEVSVSQTAEHLIMTCPCRSVHTQPCEHQSLALYTVVHTPEFRIFFDPALREEKLRKFSRDYGLEKAADLDDYFEIRYNGKDIDILSRIPELIPLDSHAEARIKTQLLPEVKNKPEEKEQDTKIIVVIGRQKHYEQLDIRLYRAVAGKEGKIKNPLTPIDPLELAWSCKDIEEVKFYSAISKFQDNFSSNPASDVRALKHIIDNPLGLDFFFHEQDVASKATASSVLPVKIERLKIDIRVMVDIKEPFYEISAECVINDKAYPLKNLGFKHDYFLVLKDRVYFTDNLNGKRIIDFFRKNKDKLLIHSSRFESFRKNILEPLGNRVNVNYSYIRPATKKQVTEQGFDQGEQKIIYLEDLHNHVSITPVIKYGNVEIPVLSRKQIQDTDANGNVFMVERDNELELGFISSLLRQHPDFEEQLNEGDAFYINKKEFLDETWLLDVFETWTNDQILILGFNDIKNNKINPNKGKINIEVKSGIDWFNTTLSLQYGKQKAGLKQLQKAVRHKNKYVQLDDGSMGILPEVWLKRLEHYLTYGEVVDDLLRIPKQNFPEISSMYEEEVLSAEVREEISSLKKRFSTFESIKDVKVPDTLHAELRDYQKQGLNWLNFLDEFNFGACLADDMGLGKTLQIIAFILSQRDKAKQNTNLVIVPTSLLFNWQEEVRKFAPSIRIFTNYGQNKIKNAKDFEDYEIILTTYGMMLSDMRLLKSFRFNYIFLDESQAIKNPSSQRYKAARLLQSRNRITITGTPIENNTFDLYGQMSFACPGLLGSFQNFKDQYAIPIDKFGETAKAAQLQKKVSPFILRRTKKQVASELPEKTEMVIYCEMGEEQRKVYQACEKEFKDYIASRNTDELSSSNMHVLKYLTRLRQICNSPALLKDEAYHGGMSSKIEVLAEQVESKSREHKILVFSQFVSMLDLIKKELDKRNIRYAYLTGQTRNRAATVNTFRENDDIRVFLVSLKAGGTGLNLMEADYVYLVDPWWNPAVENQAIDRSHRIGQKNKVVAVRLICPDTVEDKIMQLQTSKKQLAGHLIKSESAILQSFSKKDLMELLT